MGVIYFLKGLRPFGDCGREALLLYRAAHARAHQNQLMEFCSQCLAQTEVVYAFRENKNYVAKWACERCLFEKIHLQKKKEAKLKQLKGLE